MVEVLEVLLMATVYSESRRTALAPRVNNSRWGARWVPDSWGKTYPPEAAKLGDGKLVNVPFVLRDLESFELDFWRVTTTTVFPRAEKLKTDAGSHAIGLQWWVVWSNGLRLFDAL